MPDCFLDFSDDLQVSPTGDLLMVDGDKLTQQRIVRRLSTAVNGYIWHLEYGAGLPQKIGKPSTQLAIQSLVRAHIVLESTVAKSPPPIITVDPYGIATGAFVITIVYYSLITGKQQTLSFGTT